MRECPFCDPSLYESESALVFTKTDSFPVSEGHTLVIPKRHIESYFDVSNDERDELWEMVERVRTELAERHSPDGFNIGINVGVSAGQTVPHMHIHVIPRYTGDVPNPAGGVRGVIPHKQKY